jgi:hypothetical protein
MKKGGVIMKQKKSEKKLNLNKETVAILDSRKIGAVHGGGSIYTFETQCNCCETGGMHSCPPPRTQDPTVFIICCA